MIAEKQLQTSLNALQPNIDSAQTLLSDLTSSSRVAYWRLIFWIVAFTAWFHEKLWDETKADIEKMAASLVPGTTRWYANQSLLFQYGDQLIYLNDRFQYASVNLAARIITNAAAIDNFGSVLIKVAKTVGSNLAPLSPPELAAFTAYIGQIKYAGVSTSILSLPADQLRLFVTVYYDPQLLTAQGQLINASNYPVEDSINSTLKTLPYNGEYRLSAQTDSIQKAQGVVDVVITAAFARYSSSPFLQFTVGYNPQAGYMVIDPSTPLSATITYIAHV
ncbi:hypothetical protein [Nodularia spumigena]|uniref:hypothetical protein n=1 Tax=Nodularia spumigena TaxID=70799 RepID=UPI00232E1D23|nr:hypothetical protein [Nodularia spumigena]MDB9498563.1 hypothetical protein [Nodularia spumigena CS-336/02]